MLWYDNEWGYAARVADMAFYMALRGRGIGHDEARSEIAHRAEAAPGRTEGAA